MSRWQRWIIFAFRGSESRRHRWITTFWDTDFSISNLSLSKLQIREMVARRSGLTASEACVRRFLRRHRNQLRTRTCKALEDKRVGAIMMANAEGFCSELKDFLETHHFAPSTVMNFDGTRLVVKGGHLTTQCVVAVGKQPPNAASTRKCAVASLLTFAVAEGSNFMSVYVLKAKFNEEREPSVNFFLERASQITRRSWPRFFSWTDTGFLDADLFGRAMDLVADAWAVRNPGIPLLLFGDQCSAHMRADTLERALERGMYLFSLLPTRLTSSSHWTRRRLGASTASCGL